MKIYNEVILSWNEETQRFDIVYEDSYDYGGAVDLAQPDLEPIGTGGSTIVTCPVNLCPDGTCSCFGGTSCSDICCGDSTGWEILTEFNLGGPSEVGIGPG